jgi:hypothetical protein
MDGKPNGLSSRLPTESRCYTAREREIHATSRPAIL